jgi:hypothetical protein
VLYNTYVLYSTYKVCYYIAFNDTHVEILIIFVQVIYWILYNKKSGIQSNGTSICTK